MAKKEKTEEEEKPKKKVAEEATCKNCRFKIRNLCHRFPPKDDRGFARVKNESDWCGEHKPVVKGTPEPEQE